MGGKRLGFGLSLFGYRRSAVLKMIQDDDRRFHEAETRMRSAEARVAELEAELASVQAQNARLEGHLELLRGQMVAVASRTQPLSHYLSSVPQATSEEVGAAVEPPVPAAHPEAGAAASPARRPSASGVMVEELARVLAAAEEGATRMIERAAIIAQAQIARSTKAWQELQAEAAKVTSWRRAMGPVITTVRSSLGDVRARIDEIPSRIQEALAPLADAMSSIEESLGELASMSRSLTLPEEFVAMPPPPASNETQNGRPSPNGQVESAVIRVPEAGSTMADATGWMRATVGY